MTSEQSARGETDGRAIQGDHPDYHGRSEADLDPHARAADFTLRPDPEGRHDRHVADADPHARADDFTFRADPAGEHDPLRGAGHGSAGAASDIAGRAREGVDGARRRAAGYADDLRDYASDRLGDARERAAGFYEDTRDWVSDARHEQARRVRRLTRRGQVRLGRGRNEVEHFVQENPLLVGVVGVAAGLLLGALLPRTRQEDRNLGPYADELRAQGLHYARDLTHRGREFVANALDPEAVAPEGTREQRGAGPDADDVRTLHRL